VLRHRPAAALLGSAGVGVIALATLPIVGIETWSEWFAQLQLARDPVWELRGYALVDFQPVLGLVVAVVALGLVLVVPRRHAGAWVGLLATVGALSLHIFGLLFLLPAMLRIRHELALVAAICIATYSYEGSWAGIVLVAVAFVAGTVRPALLEPTTSSPTSVTANPTG
jgi:hypothetical protein